MKLTLAIIFTSIWACEPHEEGAGVVCAESWPSLSSPLSRSRLSCLTRKGKEQNKCTIEDSTLVNYNHTYEFDSADLHDVDINRTKQHCATDHRIASRTDSRSLNVALLCLKFTRCKHTRRGAFVPYFWRHAHMRIINIHKLNIASNFCDVMRI